MRRRDSPEIPFQTAAGPSDGLDASSPGNSFVGLRVVAKWSSNGYFYSGKITQDVGAGKYKLLFDDGHECDVLGRDTLRCDPIPLDTDVTASRRMGISVQERSEGTGGVWRAVLQPWERRPKEVVHADGCHPVLGARKQTARAVWPGPIGGGNAPHRGSR